MEDREALHWATPAGLFGIQSPSIKGTFKSLVLLDWGSEADSRWGHMIT